MIADKKQLPFISVTSRVDVDPVSKVRHVIETVDLSQFDAKLISYLGVRAVHRFTVGIEAPWPEHEFMRVCAEAIERGEPFELVHADQFNNDWDAAIATDKALGVVATTLSDVVQTDPPTLWARISDAWNVLIGKVTVP